MTWLKKKSWDGVQRNRIAPVDEGTLKEAQAILDTVRMEGDAGLRASIERFENRTAGDLLLGPDALERGFRELSPEVQGVLERTAARIRLFAEAQRACVSPLTTGVEGGQAGHTLAPVERAACYAPGGRYPLPSSVLMTACTARAAGVRHVLVVSPSDNPVMLGAAFVAGADAMLLAGGAHAIGAVAYGTETIPPVDVIVGPGNRWVTAAKQRVSGLVGIDMLAGPSELVVLASGDASAEVIAADLIAQAEHDEDAIPTLVTWDDSLASRVDTALGIQLATLPTGDVAREAFQRSGGVYVVEGPEEAVMVVNELAPEHLEIIGKEAEPLESKLQHYGGLFVGAGSAEVLGDYGIGPNHVLPTGGTARYTGGLSVMTFLRIRTWMKLNSVGGSGLALEDAVTLARLEGLEGHARSAEARRPLQTWTGNRDGHIAQNEVQ